MSQRRVLFAVLVVALLSGGTALAVNRASSGGDIFLEGAGDTGANPFTTVAAVSCAPGYQPTPTSGPQAGCVPVSTTSTLADPTPSTSPGSPTTTALYGGSGSQKRCDPAALVTYLTTHPDKAKAWVQGQNEDPTLQWSGGNKLTVADIPAFIHELTSTFLTTDTRVTNHGFFNGQATPHQSVLQEGTAVLVDRNGVPRARSACGNPLGRPHRVRNPHYRGHCWDRCHSLPYCAPPGCAGSTTSTSESPTTSTSTSTSTCAQQPTGVQTQAPTPTGPDGCPSSTTQTVIVPRRSPTITDAQPPATTPTQPSSTVTLAPTTTVRRPTTTVTNAPTTSVTRPTTTTSMLCPPPEPIDCKP